MADLSDQMKKNELLSKDEKVRKKVSEILGQVRKVIEQAKDYKQLEGRLQAPVYPVVRAPLNLGAAGAGLALVVALCQILEGLLRIRKRNRA